MKTCLLVSEPPSFVEDLKPQEVVKGSVAELDCQVAGTTPFEVTWHKDNKLIRPSQKHIIKQCDFNVALKIQDCDVSDMGDYQLIVANEVGSCSGFTTVSMRGLSCNFKLPLAMSCL